MIHVLLVQENRLFSEGVKAIIEADPEIDVIGIIDTTIDIVAEVEKRQPDIIILDMKGRKIDGIQATSAVKKAFPNVKVVFMSGVLDEELILRGISAHVDGFLSQDMYPDTCRHILHQIHRGEHILSGDVAKILVRKIRHLTKDKRVILKLRLENNGILLTERELDVAYMLFQGNTNQRIASHLGISEGTVKNYISEIYHKLNIHRRKEAVQYLIELVE